MQKQCTQCKAGFEVTGDDKALLAKLSPTFNGKEYSLPEPTLCFQCRLQRRLAFYNARSLYRNTCTKTGRPVISVYSPDKPYTVYQKDVWYSDDWDPLDYGIDFDFTRPFFDQFQELMLEVPLPNIAVLSGNVNSDYTNDNYKTKNSYMIFDGEQAENCYHGQTYTAIRDCVDFLHLMRAELCYECIHCYDSYTLRYSRFCHNCSDSWFLRDCTGCKNCFGCANLRQKQYCIFNEQKSKEEYEEFLRNFTSTKHSTIEQMRLQAEEFFQTQPVKAVHGEQNENSIGDNLNHCKNCYYCFDCNEHQDTRYCSNCLISAKDCMDVHIWGDKMELCYESCVIGAKSRSVIGGYYVTEGVENIYYSLWCSRSSRNLFGCIGLRHKEYCIFNKQYSKEEYEIFAARMVEHMTKTGEWGEYYPASISMFGYNETMAQSFFPLKKEIASQRGFQWSDYESKVDAEKIIQAEKLPDDSTAVPDDILHWAVVCEVTGKPFKIVKQELEFYRTHKLPIPRRHPDQRHMDRFILKNPFKFFMRNCTKCSKNIQTTYAPSRPEKVYCEECYLAEVYS
jgi:hypothetical protein